MKCDDNVNDEFYDFYNEFHVWSSVFYFASLQGL